jgi:hypothetical protein
MHTAPRLRSRSLRTACLPRRAGRPPQRISAYLAPPQPRCAAPSLHTRAAHSSLARRTDRGPCACVRTRARLPPRAPSTQPTATMIVAAPTCKTAAAAAAPRAPALRSVQPALRRSQLCRSGSGVSGAARTRQLAHPPAGARGPASCQACAGGGPRCHRAPRRSEVEPPAAPPAGAGHVRGAAARAGQRPARPGQHQAQQQPGDEVARGGGAGGPGAARGSVGPAERRHIQRAPSRPPRGSQPAHPPDTMPAPQMEYVCDESGCVVVFPGQSAADSDNTGLSISGEDWKIDSRRCAARAHAAA